MADYGKMLSRAAVSLKPSGIRKFFDMLGDMKDVISLTVGQPDFVTPWHIREAGIRSLEEGRTYYTSNNGLAPLREQIALYQNRRFGLSYSPANEIIVTVGGSEAIDLALRALINPGDEIIVPEPCFVCYSPLTVMSGGVPVPVPLKESNSFCLTAQELKAAITPRTKALILAFPNNPTGAVMGRRELEEIAEVLCGTDIAVISDEIYAELTYDAPHVSIASLPGMRERTIVVGGFSKAHAMTGWRLGYLMAPPELTEQMFKIHQYGIMCAPTASQFAAVEALANGDADIEYMKNEYNCRRKLLLEGLKECGLECFTPRGAFYAFPKVSSFGLTSEEFCTGLIEEEGVAIVPGSAFGESGEGFARISYAYSVRHIEKALERIESFVRKIK